MIKKGFAPKKRIDFLEQKNVILEQKLFFRCAIIKIAEHTAVFIYILVSTC